MLFDTHAHVEDEKFSEDYEEVVKRAKDSGVELILDVGCDIENSKKAIALAEKYPFFYAAVGLHPHDARLFNDEMKDEFIKLAKHPKVVAIGEIGLDYYYDFSPRDVQREVFRKQIRMAKELKLPIIIHDRDAHADCLDIVKEEKAEEVGGVFHAFSSSVEMAEEVLKHNFYISIGGALTFKNNKKTVKVAEWVPLDKLLIETDCPYLTPVPFRGKRNEPAYVKLVAEKIAEIKGISYEEVAKAALENGKKLFNIE